MSTQRLRAWGPWGALACFFGIYSASAQTVYPGCVRPPTSYSPTIYIDPIHGKDSGSGTATSPLKTLQNALAAKRIKPGAHVILKPGDHGAAVMTSAGKILLSSSLWTFLDFQEGAVLQRLEVRDLNKIYIKGVKLMSPNAKGTLAKFFNVRDGILTESELSSTDQTSGWSALAWRSASNAISIKDSTCISVTKNSIRNIRFGIDVGVAATKKLVSQNRVNVLIEDNHIQNFSGDGIRPIASNIIVRRNSILDAYVDTDQGDANHDDGIQLWSINGSVYDSIELSDNWIQTTTNPNRPYVSDYLQGIGYFDGIISNLVIRGNVILIKSWHGITASGARYCLIENNTVANMSNNGRKTWISVQPSKQGSKPVGCVVRKNIAHQYVLHNSGVSSVTNLTYDPTRSLAGYFQVFNISTAQFNLMPRAGTPLYGSGAGAF